MLRLWIRKSSGANADFRDFVCFPPAAGIAGLSVIQLFSQTDTLPARVEIYIVCGLTAAQAGILLLSITKKQAEKTIVGGVSRYFEIALLCALLPINGFSIYFSKFFVDGYAVSVPRACSGIGQ